MKKKNKIRRARKPTFRQALHHALEPLAEGCMATAVRAYDVAKAWNWDKDAAMAVNLAADTLAKINKLDRRKENK